MELQSSGISPTSVSAQTPANVPLVLFREPTLVTIANSTAETNIFNQTIPGGAMGTNRMLCVKIFGDRRNNSGATETPGTFRIYLGGIVQYEDASERCRIARIALPSR